MITLILLMCHKGLPGVCAFAQSFIKIINKIGKKKFSKETNIAISTINYWNQKNSSKTLSTYTYKKMVDVFKKYKIKY